MAPYTLQDGVNHLYQVARTQGRTTSTERLRVLAEYCCQELAVRGLQDAKIDPEIPGYARVKTWDVVWLYRAKARLALSLKSILANLAGTVPNRGDDLMGEAANLQMYSPEAVIGYLMIFNVADDEVSKKHGCTWSALMRRRLESISGRRAPYWTIGTVEASAFVEVNFAQSPILVSGAEAVNQMFDTLAEQVYERNPDLLPLRPRKPPKAG